MGGLLCGERCVEVFRHLSLDGRLHFGFFGFILKGKLSKLICV